MSFSSIQPHFSISVDLADQSKILTRIKNSVEEQSEKYEGQFTTEHALLSFQRKQRHFWSPWLHLEIRDQESSPYLYGWFTPHPSVWTGFVFAYLVVGCLASLGLITGLTQQLLKMNAWGYYGIPVMAVAAVVLWVVSRTGQKLAAEEMIRLKEFASHCVSESGKEQ